MQKLGYIAPDWPPTHYDWTNHITTLGVNVFNYNTQDK